MAHKKRKKLSEQEIFLKAFKKANREIEMERNVIKKGQRYVNTE